MRVIGQLGSEEKARLFGDFLYAEGIENEVEAESSGQWAVWVKDEERLETALEHLRQFRTNPDDARYRDSVAVAGSLRERERELEARARKKTFDRQTVFPRSRVQLGTVTLALILVTVLVGLFSGGAFSGNDVDEGILQALSITAYESDAYMIHYYKGLPEIRRGQIWRLFTPILIHFGLMHLAFNMFVLLDVGNLIEARSGRWILLGLVLAAAPLSNLAQYVVSGPGFGGMSGVVYGLLGYAYVRGRLDFSSGLMLRPMLMTMAMIWFFLCLFGVIPNVANTAHAVGLMVGAGWGYLAALWSGRPLR